MIKITSKHIASFLRKHAFNLYFQMQNLFRSLCYIFILIMSSYLIIALKRKALLFYSGYATRRSASESNSRSPMYFPEVDVDVRTTRSKGDEPDFRLVIDFNIT
jgi:hypothetical protein